GHLGDKAHRNDDETTEYDGGHSGDLGFAIEVGEPLLESRLKLVGALARFLRIEACVGASGLLLELELGSAVVPVGNFLRQPVLDRSAGLLDPPEAPVADFLDVLGDNSGDGVAERFLLEVPCDPSALG